jgi:fructose-1,6-bisphosphatase/inositol monophosphatase family enzyme
MGAPLTPAGFVDALRPAMRQAAAIAAALEGRVENEPKAGEDRAAKAALTIADTAAQEAILVPLWERWPHLRIEAEEDTATAALFADSGPALVVVDPIDGTLHCFLRGLGPYAVMAGLAVDEAYVAGLVALPREGIQIDGAIGEGVRISLRDEAPRTARCDAEGRIVLVAPETSEAVRNSLVGAGWDPRPASGGAIAVAPLLPGIRAGLRIASGTRSISVRGRIGVMLAREAGAVALRGTGSAFPDDLHAEAPRLIVAGANDAIVDDLLEAARLA